MAIGDKSFVADKETVDTVNANVGSNVDASSATGSVHGKLKYANERIVTINSNTNATNTNVGSNADASSSTGSVHAKLKDIKTFVNGINGKVGQDEEPASPTGSVHAKLKDIKASLGGGGEWKFAGYSISFQMPGLIAPSRSITIHQNPNAFGTLYQTVTGKGVINVISVFNTDDMSKQINVLIDGKYRMDINAVERNVWNISIPFSSSFKIYGTSPTTGTSIGYILL